MNVNCLWGKKGKNANLVGGLKERKKDIEIIECLPKKVTINTKRTLSKEVSHRDVS